jgi:uncharacterized membrane protein YgdD (TMEM256/DUF423 family)
VASSFVPLWAELQIRGFRAAGIPTQGRSFPVWSDAYGILLKVAIIAALAAVALTAAKAIGARIELPFDYGVAYLALAGGTLALMILVMLSGPNDGGAPARLAGIEISRGILLFCGTALAAVMAVGAWLHISEPSPRRPSESSEGAPR